MFPFNEKWQKCCLPVGNVPNIERIVKQLLNNNISNITVIGGVLNSQVMYALRGYEGRVTHKTASKEGLAHAIADVAGGEDFLVFHGDIYVSENDLKALLQSFEEKGSSVLLEVNFNSFRNIDNICAKADEDKIHAIYGHPREHYANTRLCGVYALSSDIAKYLLYAPETFLSVPCGGMPKNEFYIEQSLQTALEDGAALYPVFTRDRIVDLDFAFNIFEANQYYCMDVIGAMTESAIDKSATVSENATVKGYIKVGKNSYIGDRVIFLGNCVVGDNTVIDNGAIIGKNCCIGDNCTVTNYCKLDDNTVIGNQNKIGFTAEVSGVTLDKVAIVHNCEIYGVIGKNVDVAAGCVMAIMRFDDTYASQKINGKTYCNKYTNGIFIGDYTRTGVANIFSPGVRVGSNCALGPGLHIIKDIEKNQLLLAKQEIVVKPWGSDNYGW